MIRYPLILAATLAASLSLSACMHEPSAPSAPGAASNPGYMAAAIADSNRPDGDKLRDANRKPAQTLFLPAAGLNSSRPYRKRFRPWAENLWPRPWM